MIEALLFAITGTLIVVTFTDIAKDYKLAVGRWILHLIGWKPQASRVYEQLRELSPDWTQISDEAVAAIESLSDAFIASQIARGTAHQEIEPNPPQPEGDAPHGV
jgi:hypothetical protein